MQRTIVFVYQKHDAPPRLESRGLAEGVRALDVRGFPRPEGRGFQNPRHDTAKYSYGRILHDVVEPFIDYRRARVNSNDLYARFTISSSFEGFSVSAQRKDKTSVQNFAKRLHIGLERLAEGTYLIKSLKKREHFHPDY